MPINNTLPKIKKPVKFKTGSGSTEFKDQYDTLSVTLVSAPSYDELLSYIPEFGTATWRDKPESNLSNNEKKQVVQDLFDNHILPTAYETIGLTFRIEGMDIIDTTHLIRHRVMSFSSQCSADRDCRNDPAVVKPGILYSKYFNEYEKLINDCKALYAKMVDEQEVSILDARTILPRNLETFYYARINLKDAISFIKTRIDRQIQPASDNIIAILMYKEIVKIYPQINIDLDSPDRWYISTAPTGRSSNIYMPEKPRNDTFEYNEQWFLYKKTRDEFLDSQFFIARWNEIVKEINEIKK